jgi:hypothetical protein
MVVYCCYARRRRVRRLRPIAKVVPERRPILLLLELGFVLPRVVEFVVLGRHGIVVVVDHVVRERAADGFLADGLDVRQGLADARALRREGRSGGDDARFRGRNGRTCRHGGVPAARARSPGEPARWPGPAPRTRRRDPAGAPRGTSAGTPPARAATWSRAVGLGDPKNGTRGAWLTEILIPKRQCESRETLCRNPRGGFISSPVTSTRASPRWRTSRCAMRARSTGKAATLSRDPRSTRTRRSTTRGTIPSGTSKAD